MAQFIMRAQVVLPFFTGDPSDVITNQFHFDCDDALDSVADISVGIALRLDAFLKSLYGGATGQVRYIDWPGAYVNMYDMRDVEPRINYRNNLSLVAGTAVDALPTEVAMVLSWKAAPVPGLVYQSLYNRIYIGALRMLWLEDAALNEFPVFTQDFIDGAIFSAQELYDSNSPTATWVQVGKGLGGPQTFRTIIGGFVDNSPDTQRRRSVEASARTNYLV
uniref:Uncharacterized protein n=1 Tax=uncultured prokaryote TaxID=198431 RepID=A0A0H5Q773_9ZZZZ|nr:hypothetical protein [uncultured prokaryote]